MNARSAGFTLIEVLITIFVAGIGLLAVAGLQAMAKKFNYDAAQRTSASTLAQSLVESLRGNPGALDGYLTADASTVAASVNCGSSSARCTPGELAAYDLWRWNQSLIGAEAKVDDENTGGLVEPTGCVYAGGTAGLYVVVVAWRGVTGLDEGTLAADDPRRCGLDSGRYDDPRRAGSDNRMQRTLAVEAFVADPNAP